MSQTPGHSDSEAASRPAVSIVLVNYNSAADTNECLASIDDVPFDDYEVLVVDNNSDMDPIEAIDSDPDVELLRSAENVGFARGCNTGARRASGEYLFFLNNDATVTEGLLPRLAAYVEENNGVAAAVPHVLFEHDRKKIDKGLSAFDNLGFGWHPNHLLDVEAESVPTGPCETPWGSGCALLVDRRAFEEVGGFDDDFFMYNEDLELCIRLRKHGYSIHLVPDATVYHKYSRSVKDELDLDRSPFQAFHEQRNRAKLLSKHYPARVLLRSLPQIVGSFLYWDLFLVREESLGEGLRALKEQVKYVQKGLAERSETGTNDWIGLITNLSIIDYASLALNRESFYTGEYDIGEYGPK